MKDFAIKYQNRTTGEIETEKVYGDKVLKFIYTNPIGKGLSTFISQSSFSKIYGKLQDAHISHKKVRPFIENFDIPIDDYQPGSVKSKNIRDSYFSFNEFFIRKFTDGKRTFSSELNEMPAPCEARYLGWNEITDDQTYPVKGEFLNAKDLLDNEELAADFTGGPLYIARLCPVDYHRYHYPDSGTTSKSYTVKGKFYSVNPMALRFKGDIFIKNERRVSILETENFGKLAYIEVGATCVGKIIQSHNEDEAYKRGQEKGYFLFGASTVVVLGQPGKWKVSKDIVENSKNKIETYIKIGDTLASKA
jgi:phosphatidylserine decarboxylase